MASFSEFHKTWTPYPHGPLVHKADNLWLVEGSFPDFPLNRWMTVVRLSDGRLLLHSATALEESAMKQLEQLGTPAIAIVPNGWHRLDLHCYKHRYPDLRVLCPADGKPRVEKVAPVDATYGDSRDFDESSSIEYVDGTREFEGVLKIRSSDGVTLVFNDLLANNPRFPGAWGMFYGLFCGTGRPTAHRAVKLMKVRDRRAMRAHLERLASEPDLRRVVPGHGAILEENAAETLQEVARRV